MGETEIRDIKYPCLVMCEIINERYLGAQGGSRTLTPIRTHGPQPCLSTNSSTWAVLNLGWQI